MRPSTLVYVSAELTPGGATAALSARRRSTVAAALARPSGRAGLVLLAVTLAVAIGAPLIAGQDPFALSGAPLSPPSFAHLMGTDALGRDLLSGVAHGGRASLLIAAAVTLVAVACGVSVGIIAGFRGGLVDDLLSRAVELFQVIPRLFIVAIVMALFGPGLDRLILTLGLTSWPTLARVVRGEVLATRNLDYILASRALGASPGYIAARGLLPNVMPGVLVMAGLLFGQALLTEASLGFLGLGDPSTLSWGLLVGQSQGFLRVAWWLTAFPGLAITVAILSFNLLADALSAVRGGR
ncbi:MAG: ABC transporter permease [Gemmatimonadaceae bacterium]